MSLGIHNVLAGLTESFVTLSLGANLNILIFRECILNIIRFSKKLADLVLESTGNAQKIYRLWYTLTQNRKET